MEQDEAGRKRATSIDDLEHMLTGTTRRRADPFSEVVASYDCLQKKLHRPAFSDLLATSQAVCPNGVPRTENNGKLIDWHTGLGSFCRMSSRGVFGEIAEQHSDALLELYEVWEALEGTDIVEPMYRDTRLKLGNPFARGAFLVPRLQIHDRERLSDHYINVILRPFAQAEIALRKRFFKAIEASHRNRQWIGFRPSETGRYVPILPSSGFDGTGGYSIDRATYLEGLGYSEDEFATENFPARAPYQDQDNWIFLGAEAAQELNPGLENRSLATTLAKRGRPRGTGFDAADRPFVELGVEMVQEGVATGPSDAAWRVIEKHGDEISGSGCIESKQTRIRKKISERLKIGTP